VEITKEMYDEAARRSRACTATRGDAATIRDYLAPRWGTGAGFDMVTRADYETTWGEPPKDTEELVYCDACGQLIPIEEWENHWKVCGKSEGD